MRTRRHSESGRFGTWGRRCLARATATSLAWIGLFCAAATAQNFTGTNAPGGFTDIPLSVGPGATNLAISVNGTATTFSYLLLKAGSAPNESDYDFRAALDGSTNFINLEFPELRLTNYVLRVFTPGNSLSHAFTVTTATNVTGLRLAGFPATKSLLSTNLGNMTSGVWHYFRVDIPTNLPGWRIRLDSPATQPDLYVQRGQLPSAGSWLKRNQGQTNDLIAFTAAEATPGTYYIGVFQNSGAISYTLTTELTEFSELTWDPGVTDAGSQVYTNAGTNGGDFYFKLVVQNTSLGAWRTALTVLAGEADVYLNRGSPPNLASNLYKSERLGSDGFVVPATAFTAGEDWYLMVRATPNAQWKLLSGEPFVTDLGTVAADGSSGSGNVAIGPEGHRFFKTSVPINTLAWRLWLNGATNSIMVRKTFLPLTSNRDLIQAGQMLVVPNYLGVGEQHFVAVSGAPGEIINLDSRQHTVQDLAFGANTNLVVNGFGYTTYRVQVPADLLAWNVNLSASAGNPNVAVRRNLVPNESNNDAYSEAPGLVNESITLVPPTLSDGTFYITVYGTNAHTFSLQNGTPEITLIDFASVTTNNFPLQVGWRFFQVANIEAQLGALGWDLFLTNFAPGTQIALRRNAVPSIWNYRNPSAGTTRQHDYVSTGPFLQRPDHQADVWYVGVYNPNVPLGNFVLHSGPLSSETVSFNNGTTSRADVPAGKWQFFRVDVPTNVLGWDLRLTNVTSGRPRLVVRREALPISLSSINMSAPVTATNWATGNQWVADADWTARNLSADGAVDESGRVLTMGMGRPLTPGTYYVGVLNYAATTNALSYTLVSRGIGPGQAIPVETLDYASGTFTNLALAPREVAIYQLDLPTNAPSWKVKLTVTSGDALLAVARDRIPNITAASGGLVTNIATAGKKMLKAGNEHYVQLPGLDETNLHGGRYYLVVASEGAVNPSFTTRIGSAPASYILRSLGAMPEIDLGTLGTNDLIYPGTLEGGESLAFHFHNVPETLGFELTLEDRVGNPMMVSRGEMALANPGAASSGGGGIPAETYGNDGGANNALQASSQLITVADPFLNETIMLKARGTGGVFPDAEYVLRVRNMIPQPRCFDTASCPDGGLSVPVCQTNVYQYFKIEVPAEAAGWDVRITNVSGGDPVLMVSRDFLPLYSLSNFQPGAADYWPSGGRWVAGDDWTQRALSADGAEDETGRILAMGMGQPLEAGTYYVGVYNPNHPNPVCYNLLSRGIGDGFAIPLTELAFAGGIVTNASLAPREAAYYRVNVPANASSWQVRLTCLNGEALLLAVSNTLPNVLCGRSGGIGKLMQKLDNEHYVLLPPQGQTNLAGGEYYLAVVSEGVAPASNTRIGASNVSFVIESRGQLAMTDLGVLGAAELTATNQLQGGEVAAYRFTAPAGVSSLEAQLVTFYGSPAMVLRAGEAIPYPGAASVSTLGGAVAVDNYGNEGGSTITLANGNATTNLLTVDSPSNGVYTIVVKARPAGAGAYSNAHYAVLVRAVVIPDLAPDDSRSVTNQAAGSWAYFRVEIPTNALGWDIRLTDVTSGLPRLVVRRGMLPNSLTTSPWGSPGNTTAWPMTNQWAAGNDWTRRTTSADGAVVETGRILAMGMGQPLEPGTYYVGVINSSGTAPMSYRLVSRTIGNAGSIPVTDVAFDGGSATRNNLLARDAAYFRVEVPSNAPSWKLKLTPISGEVMLVLLNGKVPNVDSGNGATGKAVQKAGNEHYVLLPTAGKTNIPGGSYYLAVISEGVNPATSTRIGSGSSSFTLQSLGPVTVTNLGTLAGPDLLSAGALEGGESAFYQFTVPAETPAFELRLEDRVGNPVMVLLTNTPLPHPGSPSELYGNEGGVISTDVNPSLLTMPGPTQTVYTVAVKARSTGGNVFPGASYTLRVHLHQPQELNFAAEFNTNGLSHTGGGSLLDNQRTYFRVVVPTNVHSEPVIGWELNLSQLSGVPMMRVRKDAVPSDAFTGGMPFTPASAVLVPPFLTPGTWFVEVRGSNFTAFTLSSSPIRLQRPPWDMPVPGGAYSTPGLSAPEFGDTGVTTNGTPLSGDQGVDLEQGRYHYYAVNVPTNNGGLMRVRLDAISGNPDLCLRENQAPTYSHKTNGVAGSVLDRSLAGTMTQYGNWVPLKSTEVQLTPGRWYLGVRAVNNANARYRVRLSTGFVQDLALHGGNSTNQSAAGNDWYYFRVQVPDPAPAEWRVTFQQQIGDVVLHLRDLVPPGNGADGSATEYKDWTSDQKNSGPYGNFDAPGTHTFRVPPVRPGSVYYLGFRAKNDAQFTVSSSTNGASTELPPLLAFYGGFATNYLPASGSVAYRIQTPADALRWRHTSIHSTSVQVFLENGTFPTRTSTDDFRSTAANSFLDRFLTNYPWLTNQTYYLVASNTAATAQPFSITMNGSSVLADDDNDGMLDAWELLYFAGLTQAGGTDFDLDGVSNLNEFLEGTNPRDKTSLRPRLTVLATNGVVVVSPLTSNYTVGDTVTLTATPNAGYQFTGWAGAESGTANPLLVTLQSNKTIIARFRVPGDDFDQRIPLSGLSATYSGLSNAGATKESGEPQHGGNPGGKSLWWTWTAPLSAGVLVSTEGSTFRNAVAVYTGNTVSNLTLVAGAVGAFGTNTTLVSFTATADTVYHVAVDGFNGAGGNVALALRLPQAVLLEQPARLAGGEFRSTLRSEPGKVVLIEATTNFTHWEPILTITNSGSGMIQFTDPTAINHRQRFYRGVAQ